MKLSPEKVLWGFLESRLSCAHWFDRLTPPGKLQIIHVKLTLSVFACHKHPSATAHLGSASFFSAGLLRALFRDAPLTSGPLTFQLRELPSVSGHRIKRIVIFALLLNCAILNSSCIRRSTQLRRKLRSFSSISSMFILISHKANNQLSF